MHPAPTPFLRSCLAALLAGALLTVAACGGGSDALTSKRDREASQRAAARAAAVPPAAGGELHEGAVRRGLPSVVAVSVSGGGVLRKGTGTLLAPGVVVTDAALVTDAAGAPSAGVTIREGNGDEHPGVVDGIDSLSGLAALRVRELTAVPVARASPQRALLGADVVSLGFLSARRPAMRPGTIATTGRAVRAGGNAEVGLFEATSQLGAQGLGGPVVDAQGRVLGIATRALSSIVPGTVVVLPVASAVRIVRALALGGRVRRAYLGIETVGITPSRAQELGLTTNSGVLLRSILPGSPASFSTLRPPTASVQIGGLSIPTGGDAIVAVNGRRIAEPEDLDAALAGMQPGTRVTLKVIRGQQSADVHVTLGER